MPTHLNSFKFLCTVLLLTNVILGIFVEADAAIPDITINAATLHRARHTHPIHLGYKRHLRTLEAAEDDDSSEDRGFNVGVSSVTKLKDLANKGTQKISANVQKLATSANIKMTGDNQKATDKLFKYLKVTSAESNILESAQFSKWTSSVTKLYRKKPEMGYLAMVTTLTAHYGDDGLAKMIAEAKKVFRRGTPYTVKKLDEAQLAHWIKQEKHLDDVFIMLKLEKEGEKLFENPVITTWYAYATQLDGQNPEKVLLASLKKLYDDESLAKTLVAGKESGHAVSLAKRMEISQIDDWISNRKPNDVFSSLKLNEDSGNLLKNSLFETWIRYLTKLDSRSSSEVVFQKLTARYDDEMLARILAEKHNAGMVNLVWDLREMQLDKWKSNEKTVDDIFKLLKLQDEGEDLVKAPLYDTWVSYVIKMDQKSPYNTILQKLMTRYDDESLTKALRAVDAKKLEKARIENWLSNGKTADDIADDIFTSLKLNTGENILMTKTPTLNTWISNVELMKNPDELMISVLKKHYDDEALTNMITVAKKDYRTSGVASKLEKARTNTWISKGESADDVFKLLKLSKEQDELLRSATWSTWVSYVTRLDNENPDELMFSVLKKQYGDEGLAAIIEKGKRNDATETLAAKLQEEVWRSEGKSSGDVFTLLFGKIKDDEMFGIFERPEFSTWTNYITKLNNLNKNNPNKFAVISALEKQFNGRFVELARALETAKKKAERNRNFAVENILRELQTQQFKNLMDGGMDPNKLTEFLNKKFDKSNAGVYLAFRDFYLKNGGSPFFA
ncbi:Secreted RxLR effector peptide protein [Phytophthora palmivora]|uniref:Secreted RxLR effector peptide protein n=1 Tax=Phytophthora palmivora TaxID=4796 RepID=A0A2P4Y814_9STRA|nr:Secreted RxLR effector peptide protein [Phytophthora palmivora]